MRNNDLYTLNRFAESREVCIAVMVRNQHLWADNFRSLHALANSHCIWLIYRKECKVYIAKCGHLFYWLGITCHIYPESPEIKDISIATPLRVQHLPACGGVICRDNRIADTSCNLPGISIGQNASS